MGQDMRFIMIMSFDMSQDKQDVLCSSNCGQKQNMQGTQSLRLKRVRHSNVGHNTLSMFSILMGASHVACVMVVLVQAMSFYSNTNVDGYVLR